MSDQCLGEIRMFGGNYEPPGWAFCDGRLLRIGDYDALYSLIGTAYGGDGITTFALPDLRSRIPIGMGKSTASGFTYQRGMKAGTEAVTVTLAQMPMHTHSAQGQTGNGDQDNPAGGFWASPNGKNQYWVGAADKDMNTALIDFDGGGQPHSNVMPCLAVSFIIALQGVYPQQG